MQRVTDAMTRAIDKSFETCPARRTQSAIKERLDLCLALVQHLYGDLRWSLPRVLDYLEPYLRCELAGIAYNPAGERALWAVPAPGP